MLGPLHLPHQLEVGRDGGAAMMWPIQIVEHHYFEGVGMVLRGKEVEVVVGVFATCTRTNNVCKYGTILQLHYIIFYRIKKARLTA